MSDEISDFSEAFLKANANFDFIAAKFADVLRNLMRAASSDDPTTAAFNAASTMSFVVELLSRSEEKFGFYNLFLKALEEFQCETEWDSVEHAELDAARRGLKYIVENSCTDSAARGRASRRRTEFLSAIKYIDEAREYRRTRRGGNS